MNRHDEPLESIPSHLKERTRLLGQNGLDTQGEYVLYWMRTAIRTDENQALRVAIHIANHLGLPVLVYQGLSERYPYASDRHHTFVLQGARDVQLALADTDITYVLHVERPGNRGPHLKTLADRAAAVVTEDMPTEPLRSWTDRLSRSVECCLLAVDTACVVPMQMVGKAYERAFEFRSATKKFYAERIRLPDPESELVVDRTAPIDIPFEPINLQQIDLASLVSQCEIDHSIGPVTHTKGGSVAGDARWQHFRKDGLASYDRRRNNALIDGVSRLSPYLHYGMVAPTAIARQAAQEETKGAEKYLDELLIWRELAYAFCHYRRDHHRVSAIPAWARETLREHESDPRTLKSWETMSRGRTSDPIWDSAQRSLLIHGELHNNVRMTWGKAVLNWTKNAKQTLARLIDLNHRYALDGRDPASYGGILWCLGQFDRPFSPSQSVFGTVRTRPTQQHAKRLDPAAYRRLSTRPLWNHKPKVAVIGAGISGLTCARTLADHGCEVRVYEKSRNVGGRMSTRRVADTLRFDHGAQYFTARDKRFKRYVDSWVQDGVVQPWQGRVVAIEGGSVKSDKPGDRYVAVPGMNSVGKHIAADLDVHLETRVTPPCPSGNQWALSSEAGSDLGQFDIVVVALPSQQAAPLLVHSPQLAKHSKDVRMNGCWAVMLAFEDSLGLSFDGAFVHHPAVYPSTVHLSALSWIARNNSKPGRSSNGEQWVLHATPEWTEAHLEDNAEQVTRHLLDEFRVAIGQSTPEPSQTDWQRWRYAIPENPFPVSCLFDDQRWIGACGDWCGGPRVEGAFLSGMSIAGRILGRLNETAAIDSTRDQQLALF